MSKEETYNKGVESGLKVTQEIIEQEAKAMDYLKSKVDLIVDGHDEMKTAVNHLIEDANENAIGRIFGICNNVKPNEIKDYEQKTLLSILATLGSQQMNDDQKRFFNNLRHHLNIEGYEPDNSYDFKMIESLESVKSIKTIAKAVRIFLFLEKANMDGIYRHEDDLFSHFELRSFDEIDATIETIHCLFGKDGLVEFYGDHKVVEETDKANGAASENEEEIGSLEDYNISSMIIIPRGKEEIIKHKVIHMNASIKCDGSLLVDHCVLYYNETDSNNDISIAKGSKLCVHNSVIVCRGYNEKAFISDISDRGNNGLVDVSFANTTFVNCVNFLDAQQEVTATFENCKFDNCDDGFVKLHIFSWSGEGTSSFNVSNSVFIKDHSLSSEWIPHSQWMTDKHVLIDIRQSSEDADDNSVVFRDISIIEDESSYRESVETQFIHAPNAKLVNCSLKGLSQGITARFFENCAFENCDKVILCNDVGVESAAIKECTFAECKNVIANEFMSMKMDIQGCQFAKCHGQIINGSGITMEYCEFYDTFVSSDDSRLQTAIIELNRADKNEDKMNIVKKCIFDGVKIEIDDEYLIHGSVLHDECIAVEVDSCEFRNCVTSEDNGIIIKEDDFYETKLFNKLHECITARIKDCTGLDKVNKGKGTADGYEIKKILSTGEKVGCSTDGSTCGSPKWVLELADYEMPVVEKKEKSTKKDTHSSGANIKIPSVVRK